MSQQQNEILIIIAVAATINFRVFAITIIIRVISVPDLFKNVIILLVNPPPPFAYIVTHKLFSVSPCCRLRASLLWSLPKYKVLLTRIITIPVVNLSCTGMLA